jgi:hypothetical protein
VRRSGALLFGATSLVAGAARADVTGWIDAGGGMLAWSQPAEVDELTLSPLLAFDIGVGMQDTSPFIFGGLFRVQPLLGQGTDLAWLARFATESFQAGPLGFALDAGTYARFWGEGSAGFVGQAIFGAPLGLEVAALGTVGTNEAYGFGGLLLLDLARLTVHRRHLLDWWTNPRATDAMESASR